MEPVVRVRLGYAAAIWAAVCVRDVPPRTRQCRAQLMIPDFDNEGKLPAGIHGATWKEIHDRFGFNTYRLRLLLGLRAALDSLKRAGCRTVYIDGSFVTAKDYPADFDACWDASGVDPGLLDPVLLIFDRGRATQKAKFGGELFPSTARADQHGRTYLEFLQIDKNSGTPKGIVAANLQRLL